MDARTIRLVAAAGTAAALAVGGAAAASAHPAPAARAAVTYHVTSKGITGPGKLAPGRVEIKVRGLKRGAFQLVQPKKGVGKAKVVKDLKTLNSTGKPDNFERDAFATGGASSGQSFWVLLHRGTYYAFNTSGQKLSTHLKTIHVGGKAQNTAFPGGKTLMAIKSTTWAPNPKVIPHAGTMRFVNHASQPHFVNLIELKKGKTVADFKKALAGKENPRQVFAGPQFSTGAVSPGHSMFGSYALPKGHYVLTCFFPARGSGMPHAFMGMERGIVLK